MFIEVVLVLALMLKFRVVTVIRHIDIFPRGCVDNPAGWDDCIVGCAFFDDTFAPIPFLGDVGTLSISSCSKKQRQEREGGRREQDG